MRGRSSGDLRERVAFDPPLGAPDGYGGIETGWDIGNAVLRAAHFRWLRGGEAVQSARLSGRQPVVATVRASTATRAITPAWRLRDLRRGRNLNIRAVVETEDRAWIEITAESGVAV